MNIAMPLIVGLTSVAGCILAVGGALEISSSAAEKGQGPLDGKVFEVKLERTAGVEATDTVTFQDGRFRSAFFEKRGFDDALYTAVNVKDRIDFVAIAVGDAMGEVRWHGTVRGNSAYGYLLWTKPSAKPERFLFRGSIVRPPKPSA